MKTSRTIIIVAVLITFGFLAGCQSTGSTSHAAANAGPPVCVVKAEPSQVLMGEYSCMVTGTIRGKAFSNPVSYRLEQVSGGYSFYYAFRPARGSSLVGYQNATIDGNEIAFKGPTGNTIRIVTDGTAVYFVSPKSGQKFPMTRKLASK